MPQSTRFEIHAYGDQALSHSHRHHQIVLPLEGVLQMEIGSTGGVVDGAAAAAITSGFEHSLVSDNPNRFLVIDLPERDQRFWEVTAAVPFVSLDPDLIGFCRVYAAR